MHKLEGQKMNVKKLCSKENIANYGEDSGGFHLCSIYNLPLFFLSVSVSSDARW